MFRFLRFEISGLSAILWMALFLVPYFDVSNLIQAGDFSKALAAFLGSVTLSIPLGNYIHQISDSLFNPFARNRLFFWPRRVISYLDEEIGSSNFLDKSYQAIMVFSKCSEI